MKLWLRTAAAVCLPVMLVGCARGVTAFDLRVFPETVTGGEGFRLTITDASPGGEYRVHFAGREYRPYRQDEESRAIFLPLPIEGRGTMTVEVERITPGGPAQVKTIPVSVTEREVTTVRISAAGMQMRQAQPAVQKQQEQVLAAINHRNPHRYWRDGFILPLEARISAGFALRREREDYATYHRGVDFAAPQGTPVRAVNCGRVVLSEEGFNIYGNLLVVDHGQGVTSCYFHLYRVFKDAGDPVRRGEVIGEVGRTGWASGPHLHLGIYLQGVAVDPLWWFDFTAGVNYADE